MRLWTFQSKAVAALLKAGNMHQCDWQYVPKNWRPVYQFMVDQMQQKAIPIQNQAPVWAWHSCEGWQKPPTLAVARDLLSDIELEFGVVTIEFELPDNLALLSNYNRYCDLLFDHLDGEELDWLSYRNMFELKQFPAQAEIQATLPFISPDWILDVRSLNLVPANFDYNEKELV